MRKFLSVLIASLMLMVSIIPIAFASDADYTFNAPEWLSQDEDGDWATEDGLEFIGFTSVDNSDNENISTMSDSDKQALKNSIVEEITDEDPDYTIDSYDVVSDGTVSKAGYNSYRVELEGVMHLEYTEIDFVEHCYVFTAKNHIIYVQLITFSYKYASGDYTIDDLENALETGFVINEEMPSTSSSSFTDSDRDMLSNIYAGMFFVIVAIIVLAIVIHFVKKSKAKKLDKQYSGEYQQGYFDPATGTYQQGVDPMQGNAQNGQNQQNYGESGQQGGSDSQDF